MAAWEAVLIGLGLGFSLALPPGPIMAKIAFDAARGQWLRGLLVGLGASFADLTLFLLVYAGMLRVTPNPRVLALLAFVGVALMDYFAYGAWQAARRPLQAPPRGLGGFPGGYLLAMTSPFNWAWWITSGAPFLAEYGWLLVVGFFPALVITVFGVTGLFALGARHVRSFERIVSYASAVLLFVFGLMLAYHAFDGFAS